MDPLGGSDMAETMRIGTELVDGFVRKSKEITTGAMAIVNPLMAESDPNVIAKTMAQRAQDALNAELSQRTAESMPRLLRADGSLETSTKPPHFDSKG